MKFSLKEAKIVKWAGAYSPSLGNQLIMFYVYVLKSEKDGRLYVGYSNDLARRVKEHNQGLVISTKPRRPFKLIYYEAYSSEKDAANRENMLKRFSGSMIHLKKRIKFSLISK